MASRRCAECANRPVMRCGRCSLTCCAEHALLAGARCDGCERDWQEEATTRRHAKVLFAPSAAVLTGGVLFALLMPITFGSAIGLTIMAAIACGLGVGAGAGMCKVVDRSARALFLRERGTGVPTARLLPAGRHPHR
jgi:hypothetical protein